MDGVKHLFCALLWSNFSSLCLSKIGNRCKRRWANGIIREKIGAYIFSWRHQLHRFNIMISIKCVIFFFLLLLSSSHPVVVHRLWRSGWHVTITTENIHVEYRRVRARHKQRDSRELSGPPSNTINGMWVPRDGKSGDIGSASSVPTATE